MFIEILYSLGPSFFSTHRYVCWYNCVRHNVHARETRVLGSGRVLPSDVLEIFAELLIIFRLFMPYRDEGEISESKVVRSGFFSGSNRGLCMTRTKVICQFQFLSTANLGQSAGNWKAMI